MDKWLTLEQIAQYLQMSTSSIYKKVRTGRIPAYKVGRQWRFKREEIDGWAGSVKPAIKESKVKINPLSSNYYNILDDKFNFLSDFYNYILSNVDKIRKKNPIIDKWLTLNQVAQYLQVSTSSIYKMVEAEKIPAYKVGRQWRFKREEIDGWAGNVKPVIRRE